jgi:hypothetical protein
MRHCAALLLLASVGLSGCLDERMDATLTPLEGRPVSAAFAAFGPPDIQETEGAAKVYTWKVDEFGPMGMPRYLGVQYHCRVSVTVDRQGIVRSTTWKGNAYGCNQLLAKAR